MTAVRVNDDGPIRALLVMGTRPEAIKMAPIEREMQRRSTFDPQVCLTAQHRELLDEPLRLFGIQADHDLDLMQHAQSPMHVAGRALPLLEKVIEESRAEVVLVQGDTTTAFCGGFAGFHRQVPVAHVEAGLRTHDRHRPFPEEMNRRLLGPLSDWHFAPTDSARRALMAEGVPEPDIYVSGNPVVDAVQIVAGMPEPEGLPPLAEDSRLVLLTCHRREHHGSVIREILATVCRLVERFPDVEVVFPVHPNPQVVAAAEEVLADVPRVHRMKPLDYRTFVALLQRATLVLTDSGGVQEEAPTLGVPAVVLRRATERAEGLEQGVAVLAGTDPEVILRESSRLLEDESARQAMVQRGNPYGDGQASARICNALEVLLRGSEWRTHHAGVSTA